MGVTINKERKTNPVREVTADGHRRLRMLSRRDQMRMFTVTKHTSIVTDAPHETCVMSTGRFGRMDVIERNGEESGLGFDASRNEKAPL